MSTENVLRTFREQARLVPVVKDKWARMSVARVIVSLPHARYLITTFNHAIAVVNGRSHNLAGQADEVVASVYEVRPLLLLAERTTR